MVEQTSRRLSPIWKILLIVSSISLIAASFWNLVVDESFSRDWSVYISIIVFLWMTLYLLVTYKHFQTFYLFTTAYVVSLALFHLGHVVLHGFGFYFLPYYENGSMAIWLERAGWATILALGCLGVGLGTSFKVRGETPRNTTIEKNDMDQNFAATYWVGVGLLGASLAAFGLTLFAVGNIFQFSRTEIFGGVGDTRGFGFFLMVVPSAMVLMCIAANKQREKWIAYPLGIITLLALLLLGYRSSALFAALIGAVVWVKVGKKLPVSIAVLSFVFVLMAIPTVRYLRDLGSFQDVSREKIVESFEATDTKEVIQEIGGTNGIVADVLKWVPAEEPFRYGRSYLWAATTIIPNIGFQQGSSTQKGGGFAASAKTPVQYGNPSSWYIYKTNRWKFEHGLGAGFSAIAEAYLNFGYPGIVLYFTALGYLLGKLDRVDLRTHPKTLIFSAGLLWPLIKTVRNSFVVFVKPLGLIVTAIVIWRLLTFWKSHR